MGNTKSRFIKSLNHVERIILIVMFIIMVATSFLQVLNRNWLHLGLSWLEETSRFAMIYMVMVGTEMGLRDGTQIAVTGFVDLFKGTPRLILSVVTKLLVAAFCVTVFVSSFGLLAMQVQSGQITPTLRIPMYIPYAAVTIGFGLASIFQIVALIALFTSGRPAGMSSEGRAQS